MDTKIFNQTYELDINNFMNTKLTINTVKSWFHSILSIVAIALLATSCSTDKDINEGGGNLQINLKGIEEYVDAGKLGKLASTNTINVEETSQIQYLKGFDVISTTDFPIIDSDIPSSKIASIEIPKSINKVATTTPLGSNVKYKLLFYNANDNSLVGDAYDITGNQSPQIRLPLGEYKWVAYTFNTTDNLPALTGNLLSATDLGNKTFYYAQGNVTVGNGDNYLNLSFKPMTSKFVVTLNTLGMFGAINNETKVKLVYGDDNTPLKTRVSAFDILSGEYRDNGTEFIELEQGAWSEPIYGSSGGAVMEAEFSVYSDFPTNIPANSLKVVLSPLTINMDSYYNEFNVNTSKPYSRRFDNTTINLTHGPLNAAVGKHIAGTEYAIDAVVVESGVKVVDDEENTGSTASTIWARSNLYYNSTFAVDSYRYRFRLSPHDRDMSKTVEVEATNSLAPDGRAITDVNDLWTFNSLQPTGGAGTGDPCKQVYPSGLWRTPTPAEFNVLSSVLETETIGNLLRIGTDNTLAYLRKRGEPTYNGTLGLLLSTTFFELVAQWPSVNPSPSGSPYSAPFVAGDNNSTMKDLFLTGVGYYKNSTNLIEDRPSIESLLNVLGLAELSTNINGGGYYWAREGSAASYFKFSISSASLAKVNLLELLKLGLIEGSSVVSEVKSVDQTITVNDRLNIRCVRDPNFVRTGGASGGITTGG